MTSKVLLCMDLKHPTCQQGMPRNCLLRVLAGTDEIMKYMKAQCSGLAGYISMLPGPPRSLKFARSTSVPQKKYTPAAFPILYEPSGLHENQKIHIKGENHFR